MTFAFGSRSLRRMSGIHPDLRKVMDRAITITDMDFTVLEGLRTLAQQRKYYSIGKSRTMRSRHLTGHAIDIAPLVDGKITWDWAIYDRFAPVVKQAAQDVGIKIEWGGDWNWRDGPHWQLPWRDYPA
jgi:peptidoglycan L-alanyl-D-glutamate endopeptidase CwlK